MNGLDSKIAIVTGATQGIGFGIADRLAREGMKVIVTSRDASKAQEAASKIVENGGSADGLGVVVNEADSVKEMYETVIERYGAVHVLVNNAAAVRDTLLLRMKREDWDEVIGVNLGAVFQCTQGVSRIMMKQRFGRIINLSSIVGVIGNAGQANYAASKAGIIGFTKSVARELGGRGITVNAVAPGFIETSMTVDLPAQIREGFVSDTPLGRPGDTNDVAGVVAFLASDDAAFITGQVLHVDGGLVM
ncbi:MAG: 3-oxoacyl-[acyl-carrier-protein] reductase [Candidatus Latescibacteria bacterium]|jgi:3-oxoacyl-[acyl-carrier protein] reductase|nr:3-oxoacyl-[acyl-carrier-protein] reductase [Candidatus Latescibacterota bacterium]